MSPATAGTSAAKAREHLLELLRPVVTDAGYDLEDVTVSAAGRRSLVRVTVDADGGIDLDAVATVSRIVSDAMDADAASSAVLAGSYVLEVSSPGVDRPLTQPRHWRRAVGRLVAVDVRGNKREGGERLTGRVLAADDAAVRLDVDGAHRSIPWSELGHGKVQVEFNRSEGE